MADLHDLTALALARAVRDGEVGAVEVTEHALERAARLGPGLGAFVLLTAERALDQARTAQTLLASTPPSERDTVPPLLGVPCPIKDLTSVGGVPLRAGSRAFDGVVGPGDDGVVTLLERAGTIMLGKTTTPELGLPCYTEPDGLPPAVTPWDVTRSAGGSSGGAGAAVAARVVPAAHGSDGGGSIRIPASACGLVGLKPSRGRVSFGPVGVDGAGLASHGVLTRDVRDTAAFLDALAHPWPGDTFTAPPRPESFLAACDLRPGRLRVGVLTDPVIGSGEAPHSACLLAVERTVQALLDLGHEVVEAPAPFPSERWEPFIALWSVGALSAPVPPERESLLVPLTRWLRERGRAVSGLDHARAVATVQALTRETALAWSGLDLVLTPTLATLPAPVGSQRDDADPAADFARQGTFTPWTSMYNLTGRPAISLPVHEHVEGAVRLPVGVMLGAGVGREDLLLAVGARLEEVFAWQDRVPPSA